jgi:hypothetical protein
MHLMFLSVLWPLLRAPYDFVLFYQNFFYLICRVKFAFTHARAIRSYFLFPHAPAHVLRPKGPRAALPRAGFVYCTVLFTIKQAVFVYIFYVISAVGLFGIFCRKSIGRNAEMGGKSLAVFEGYINIPILSPSYAALS